MTFAACETETVGPPVDVTAEELWASLTFDSLTFGSLTFGSLPGVADPLDGVDAALLGDGTSAIAELGATSAADGGTEPTDAVWDALTLADADGAEGAWVAEPGEAAVDVTDGASAIDGATRGAGDSTFVTVGLAVVGDSGITAVTTGEVVVWVTGGADGSTACCVCDGGASTIGALGRVAGAFGGACCCGASVSSDIWTFGSGAGTGTVVVTTGSVSGLANAGAIPPVSAVREITTPDAKTATTLRLEQISSGAPMCASTPLTSRRVADFVRHYPHAQPSPPTLGLVQQLPRL